MRERRVFGNVPGFKPMAMAPVFGDVVYEIVIQTDGRGLMKVTTTKYPESQPPNQMQLMGMFLDAMNGQFQGMMQAASMLVDPNGREARVRKDEASIKGLPNGGEEKENNNSRGGDPGKPNGA